MLRARNECPISDQELYDLATQRALKGRELTAIIMAHFPKTYLIAKACHFVNVQCSKTIYTLEECGLAIEKLYEPGSVSEFPWKGTRRLYRLSDQDAKRLAILADKALQDSSKLWQFGMKRFLLGSSQYRIICRSGQSVQKLNTEVKNHLIGCHPGWYRKYDEPGWCQSWYAFN